jgi:ribose transport system permease protein
MSKAAVPWQAALALALALGVCAGLVNGILVAYANASSFIVTLGMGTVLTGVEFSMTGQKTLYDGIAVGYMELGQGELLGLNVQVWVALAVTLGVLVLLEHTEVGRYMYAAGANPEAARLSGIRVRRLRLVAFVIVGAAAALAGILLTAQSGSSFSNAGQPYLLPAFAAVFLGSTVLRGGRFNPLGTLVGVLFLGVIQTGLTMLQLSTAVVDLVQGSVLVGAILLARLGARR